MNIVDQTFCQLEYDRFVARSYEAVPTAKAQDVFALITKYSDKIDRRFYHQRLADLEREPASPNAHSYYASRYGVRGVKRYRSSTGEVIYRLPVLSFEISEWRHHFTNCYLIVGDQVTLVDTGSPSSEASMEEAFKVVSQFYNEELTLADVDNVIITHAHIDHFGGLSYITKKYNAKIYVHEDDADSIEDVPAALGVSQKAIANFLDSSGIETDNLKELMAMYVSGKQAMQGCKVDQRVKDGDSIINNYQVVHVPGHCPGHINIIVGDVIFLGDQVLMDITPHQFPSLYMKGMGLVLYMASLLKVCSLTRNIRLGLASHNHEVVDVRGRSLEIIDSHHERLADLMAIMDEPKTLNEITIEYFSRFEGKELLGYDRILAFEEIQAHLEYLDLALSSINVIKGKGDDKVFRYQRNY